MRNRRQTAEKQTMLKHPPTSPELHYTKILVKGRTLSHRYLLYKISCLSLRSFGSWKLQIMHLYSDRLLVDIRVPTNSFCIVTNKKLNFANVFAMIHAQTSPVQFVPVLPSWNSGSANWRHRIAVIIGGLFPMGRIKPLTASS